MYKYIIICIDIFKCTYVCLIDIFKCTYVCLHFLFLFETEPAADWSITCLLVPMNPVSALGVGNNHGMFITQKKKRGKILWMKMMKIWNCMEFLVLTCLEMFRPTPNWCSVVLSCCVNAPTSLHTGTTHGQYVD